MNRQTNHLRADQMLTKALLQIAIFSISSMGILFICGNCDHLCWILSHNFRLREDWVMFSNGKKEDNSMLHGDIAVYFPSDLTL